MMYKTLKVFEVIDFPQPLQDEVWEWFRSLNRTAIMHTIYGPGDCMEDLDGHLLLQGAYIDEEVVLLMDW